MPPVAIATPTNLPDLAHPVTHGVLRLTPTTEAVKMARDYVGGLLTVHDWPEDGLERAVLVVSELASNAVCHAGTDWEVRCTIDDVAGSRCSMATARRSPSCAVPSPAAGAAWVCTW